MSDETASNATGMLPETISMLQAIFQAPRQDSEPAGEEASSKTASVKFMITRQDEKALLSLGYSQLQIDMMKPQEAAEILAAKAESAIDASAGQPVKEVGSTS